MMGSETIGIIEVEGFPAAIACLDAALKAANVKLLGYELSRGPRGMVTIKLSGSGGAIQAAVAAGCVVAEMVGGVAGKLIMGRPHKDLEKIIMSPETVVAADNNAKTAVDTYVENSEPFAKEEVMESEPAIEAPEGKIEEAVVAIQSTCNICGDPSCPRRKGEPHAKCIHAND